MKLNLGVGLLFLATNALAGMVPGDYTCWAQKCAGTCDPTDGGRSGTVTGTTIHHGDNWCYLKSGRDKDLHDQPRKCDPTLGCAPPQPGHIECVTKDWDEDKGGCSSVNS